MKIPCSVPILTLNSGKTLERLLATLKNFDDVYIIDGNSTDDTGEVAKRHGIPIYKQVETDEPNVEILNFTETRNRSYKFAKYGWIFDIDSDEYITPELEGEIKKIIEENDVFKVCFIQKYPLLDDGKIVRRAFFIPDYYPRLFNLKVGIHYNQKKMVHEQLVIPENSKKIYLENSVISSWPSYEKCISKDNYYLGIMRKKRAALSLRAGLKIAAVNFLKASYIFLKSAAVFFKYPKDSLKFRYIWRFVRYHLLLSKDSLKAIKL